MNLFGTEPAGRKRYADAKPYVRSRPLRCGDCHRPLWRDEAMPPVGVRKPPETPWRCGPCHRQHLADGAVQAWREGVREDVP